MRFTKRKIIIIIALLALIASVLFYHDYNKIKDLRLLDENKNIVEINQKVIQSIKENLKSKIPTEKLQNKDVSYNVSYRTKNENISGVLDFDTHNNLASFTSKEGVFLSNYELIEHFSNFNWKKLENEYKKNIVFSIDGDDVEVYNFALFKINHNNEKHTYKIENSKQYIVNYESNALNIKIPKNHYKNVKLEIFKNGKIFETINDLKSDKIILQNNSGIYKYVLTAFFENQFLNYEDKYELTLEIKGREYMTVPNFYFRQGDLVPVNVVNCMDNSYYVKASHLDKDLKVYLANNKNIIFVPIPSYYDKDKIELYLYKGKDKKPLAETYIKVNKRDFEVQNLTIKRSAQKLKSRERLKTDREKLIAAKSVSNPYPYFSGKFIYPVKDYRVTTSFQAIRNVNKGFMTYRHSGIDMAKPMGTPVKCSNDGVVSFADETYSGGKTIIVDHGVGIFTQYMHLSKINVKQGEKVSQSQIIGEVGSTGFSTGPHLHFDMCKYLIFVDPEEMIKYDVLDDMK